VRAAAGPLAPFRMAGVLDDAQIGRLLSVTAEGYRVLDTA
jgi:hypothetical protein